VQIFRATEKFHFETEYAPGPIKSHLNAVICAEARARRMHTSRGTHRMQAGYGALARERPARGRGERARGDSQLKLNVKR
jgi:hypothetical protein